MAANAERKKKIFLQKRFLGKLKKKNALKREIISGLVDPWSSYRK